MRGFACQGPTAANQVGQKEVFAMSNHRPAFVLEDAPWDLVQIRFNGVPITLCRTVGDPSQINGWTNNPRIEMILRRWRNAGHRSPDAYPDDEEMLELMLRDDDISRRPTFQIKDLGEDVKRNGVREAIVATWDGLLLDGNRRKFAVMWALSEKGGARHDQRQLLERIPILVLPENATEADKKSIVIQENYAPSLKEPWPEVVTNGALYSKYVELSALATSDDDLQIRQKLRDEFPRFGVTEIRDRVETWRVIEEFRAEYNDDMDPDDMERLINDQFQYFRQANDTFRRRDCYGNPEFRDLLFTGIRHDLFPSFASVRELGDLFESPDASEVFLRGEGMSSGQKRDNFRLARDVAGRDRANSQQTIENRLESIIQSIDELTSVDLAKIPPSLRSRLENTLQRIIAQATASTAITIEANTDE